MTAELDQLRDALAREIADGGEPDSYDIRAANDIMRRFDVRFRADEPREQRRAVHTRYRCAECGQYIMQLADGPDDLGRWPHGRCKGLTFTVKSLEQQTD